MSNAVVPDRAHYEAMVKGPGKFECEPAWTAYFWDQVMNGDGEDRVSGGDTISMFEPDAWEREAFPELEGYDVVSVYSDSRGFVVGNKFRTDAEFDEAWPHDPPSDDDE